MPVDALHAPDAVDAVGITDKRQRQAGKLGQMLLLIVLVIVLRT